MEEEERVLFSRSDFEEAALKEAGTGRDVTMLARFDLFSFFRLLLEEVLLPEDVALELETVWAHRRDKHSPVPLCRFTYGAFEEHNRFNAEKLRKAVFEIKKCWSRKPVGLLFIYGLSSFSSFNVCSSPEGVSMKHSPLLSIVYSQSSATPNVVSDRLTLSEGEAYDLKGARNRFFTEMTALTTEQKKKLLFCI